MAIFKKIILSATSTQLSAGVWQWGQLRQFQTYQNDEQGRSSFTDFLRQHPNTKLYILADSVEEDYRVENLPHTLGSARHELLTRKLGQIYRGVTYRAAHFIARDKDKRKDDRFLFVSLNNAEFLQGWIACIQNLEAPLVGVYLQSMVSQALLKRLKLKQEHVLLSEHFNSGLRQTYLFNGSVRISRLAPIPEAMVDRLAYFYLVETEKTRLYLVSQRFVTKDTPLHMVLATTDEADIHIAHAIEQEHGLTPELIDLTKLSATFGLSAQQVQKNPELLHMHLLATGCVPDNLAPAGLLSHFKINAIRDNIVLAGVAALLIGLIVSGFNFQQTHAKNAALLEAQAETKLQEQKYQQAAQSFTPSPVASQDLRTTVELHQAITRYPQTPARVMHVLSQALEKTPQIQVNRLRWVQTNDSAIKDDDKTAYAMNAKDVGVKDAAVTDSNLTLDANGLSELAFVNGEIKDFTGDYRAALMTVNHLVDELKSNPQVAQVVMMQAPVNVSSYSNLQGSTTDQMSAQANVASFKLRVLLKPKVSAS